MKAGFSFPSPFALSSNGVAAATEYYGFSRPDGTTDPLKRGFASSRKRLTESVLTESRTRYLNEEPEATKPLYHNRAPHLVNEHAVYERGL